MAVQKRTNLTKYDEVKNKLDAIVEEVELVLEMFPRKIAFTIVLLKNRSEVNKMHIRQYQRNASYIAYFNPRINVIYISVKDADVKVLAHEIGHMIVESHFNISPPSEIHEKMAQFAAFGVTNGHRYLKSNLRM